MSCELMLALEISGHTVSRLSPSDVRDLQHLYERCSDYHQLEEGTPTRADAAEHLLAALPPGKDAADKYVIGVRRPDGELVGVLDLIRDYPKENDWWLGLLMLEPEARGSGLGGELCRAAMDAIAAQGGLSIFLGVLEQNTPAERFWRRQGFEELRRQPYTSASGHPSQVVVMHRAVA
jgi:RimJ/RimL family protein N-acetyltransferase